MLCAASGMMQWCLAMLPFWSAERQGLVVGHLEGSGSWTDSECVLLQGLPALAETVCAAHTARGAELLPLVSCCRQALASREQGKAGGQ